jgi:hypothetical protein
VHVALERCSACTRAVEDKGFYEMMTCLMAFERSFCEYHGLGIFENSYTHIDLVI